MGYSTQTQSRPWHQIRGILWLLYALPALQIGLFFTIHDPHTPSAIAIYALRPFSTITAMGILAYVAYVSYGRHRWAWICQFLSFTVSATIGILRLLPQTSLTHTLTQALPPAVYLFAIVGCAFYIQPNSQTIGDTARIIVGAVTVGFATFFLLLSLLQWWFPWPWTPQANILLINIAFDVGGLFALTIIGLRYGYTNPLVPLSSYGMFCLFLGDAILLLQTWAPWGPQTLPFVQWPLYELYFACTASAAYHDAVRSPQQISVEIGSMPAREWLLWALVPQLLILSAFWVAGSLHPAIPGSVAVFYVIAVGHAVFAERDYRRVLHNMATAQAQAERANQQLRIFTIQAADLAVEQERTRMAREIHDGLGKHLDALTIHLDVIRHYMNSNPTVAHQSLEIADNEAVAVKQEVRRAVDALLADHTARPLEELLISDVRSCELAGIRMTVAVRGTPITVPNSIKHTLYRMAQEAINNVRRHSVAEHACLEIDYTDAQQVRLVISDDGRGFDPQTVQRGRGLTNLRERAALVDGALQILAVPGAGARIIIEVPLCSTLFAS